MSASITDADRLTALLALAYATPPVSEAVIADVAQAIADSRERATNAERAACWCRTKTFRVMDAPTGCPQLVPWWLLAPFEPQAIENHGQTLERLNERGGLDPSEMLAVIEGRRWHRMDDVEAGQQLAKLVSDAITARRSP